MFCNNCGNPIPDGMKFCQNCGQPVNTGATGSNVSAPELNAGASGPKKKKKTVVIIITIAAVVLLAAIGGGLAYYFLVMAPKAAKEALLEEAQGYMDDEKYRKAIPVFQEILESDPTCIDAYVGLANAYVGKEDYDAAIDLLEDALKELDSKTLERLLDDIEDEYEDSLAELAIEVIDEPSPDPEPSPEPTPEPSPEPTTSPVHQGDTLYEAPSTEGWDDSMIVYCYCWNSELQEVMEYVLEEYPEYYDYVEFVNLNTSGLNADYLLDTLDAMSTGDKYPSIVAIDSDAIKVFLETGLSVPLSEVGITEEMYENAYPYTIDMGSYGGELMAMTYTATPGCFLYRADIAEDVLGTSDPDEVQTYVEDWDAFMSTADRMKQAGYYMLNGPSDLNYSMLRIRTSPWISESTNGDQYLTLDDSVEMYLEYAKTFYENGYTETDTQMWDMTWMNNFEGNVFGYFGTTWFTYWCISTSPDSATSTYGDWRICPGPTNYYWGGNYLVVMQQCPNPELTGFLLYELCCDEDIMYSIACDRLEFVNNRAAVEREIESGEGLTGMLGNQNPLEIWHEAAQQIDVSNYSYLDSEIERIIENVAASYVTGGFSTVDDAMEEIETDILTQYSFLIN